MLSIMGNFGALLFLLLSAFGAVAQRIAVIAPDKSLASSACAEALATHLAANQTILDDSLVRAAYGAVGPDTPFNMTRLEAKRLAAAIGSDLTVLVRTANFRRSSSQRPEYYESTAFIYVVSGRTGRLVLWKLLRFDQDTAARAADQRSAACGAFATEIDAAWVAVRGREISEPTPAIMDEPPDMPASGFRTPVPYRRIKPEYTSEAAYYDIAATVEITVDLDAEGKVLRTELERWAGFGLDESVERAVRAMNWRPAERNGKRIPMRFLLRYNFADIRKDTD